MVLWHDPGFADAIAEPSRALATLPVTTLGGWPRTEKLGLVLWKQGDSKEWCWRHATDWAQHQHRSSNPFFSIVTNSTKPDSRNLVIVLRLLKGTLLSVHDVTGCIAFSYLYPTKPSLKLHVFASFTPCQLSYGGYAARLKNAALLFRGICHPPVLPP
jgi:hypothetical protein